MKRRNFLAGIVPIVAGFNAIASAKYNDDKAHRVKVPPYLKTGDTIGITAPAGNITHQELQPAIQKLKEWGFNVRIGATIGKKLNTFSGTDEERLADLQRMLNDNSIHAILFARGGYGCARIVDRIDFSHFKKHPKWIAGFSDITVLHSHINSRFHIATLHSKMCNSFPDDFENADTIRKDTIESIRLALTGVQMNYSADANPANRSGFCTGRIAGGNLRVLENLSGTPSDLDTRGAILFIEDAHEYLYSIDRMLLNLERSGKLKHLAGLIVGGFRVKEDDPGEEFGKTLEEIVTERVSKYIYPVCFNFPVGHQPANYALRCGVNHCLEVTQSGSILRHSC